MTEDNVEKIRASLEAFSRGDWDEALKDTSSDVVIDNSGAMGEWRGVHQGHDAIRRMWHRLTDPWEALEMRVSEVIDARDDRVVVSTRARFVGREGIEVAGPLRPGWIWRFRDGKIVHVAFYNSLDDALQAAGLAE